MFCGFCVYVSCCLLTFLVVEEFDLFDGTFRLASTGGEKFRLGDQTLTTHKPQQTT
jgi:hypothetical protein